MAAAGLVIPALAAAILSLPAQAQAQAKTLVSIHVCADQLALMLARRADILSVSYNAADPDYSVMAETAAGIPTNRGHAEEVIALDPDMVIAGRHSAGPTIRTLRAMGYRVLEIPTADSLADVRDQIRTVAAAIDRKARGKQVIAELDRRLARVAGRYRDRRPRAAIFHINNQTIGGHSLVNDIIELVGLENYAATLGIEGYGHLSLERLLIGRPDLLILDRAHADRPSVGGGALAHPALARLLAHTPSVVIPSRLWSCPGPAVAEAARLLAEALP